MQRLTEYAAQGKPTDDNGRSQYGTIKRFGQTRQAFPGDNTRRFQSTGFERLGPPLQ